MQALRNPLLLFLCALLFMARVANGQNITKIEYFFDTDPGFGKGSTIAVTPGTDVTASFDINISPLSLGFHKLYLRGYIPPYDVIENGKTIKKGGWSFTQVRSLYKEKLQSSTVNGLSPIVAGEYFVDADPGFGKGTPIPVTQGTDVSNVSFAFDITSLAKGFHQLYVRFRDANGVWALTHSRSFYKEVFSSTSSGLQANITSGEYYFDQDPGFGNGKPIVLTPGSDLSASFTTDVSSLSKGFHQLYVRFRDANGVWAHTHGRSFYKEVYTTATTPLAKIKKLEYFVDIDPGFGKGTPVTVTPAHTIESAEFLIDMTNISIGNHKVYVRAQDDNDVWSMISSGDFKIEPPTDLIIKLGTIENPICAGSKFTIPFTVNGSFGSNNVFTAQLSDATGNFNNNPVSLGSVTSTGDNTIEGTIPANTDAGSNYRIRVIASSPFDTSGNSEPIIIKRVPEAYTAITGNTPVCLGTITYNVNPVDANATTYTWSLADGGTLDTIRGTSINVNWTKAGSYQLKMTASNVCGSGTEKAFAVRIYAEPPSAVPVIVSSGKNLTVSNTQSTETVSGYKWYKDGSLVANLTSSSVTPAQDGHYTVRFTNSCGEGPESNSIDYFVNKQPQTIEFNQVADVTYAQVNYVVLSATASTGLPVNYSLALGSGNIKNDTLYISGAGNFTVRASQPGNNVYAPASKDISFVVKKADAQIAIDNLAQVYDGRGKRPAITTTPANLGITVTYNGATTLPVNAGTYKVKAVISGNNFQGSDSADFVIQKAEQTITMAAVPELQLAVPTYKIQASANSGLPVDLSLTTIPEGIATLSEGVITLTGTGTGVLIATQPGNANYNAAAEVKQQFSIVGNPDLFVHDLVANKANIGPGEEVMLTWKVSNNGTAQALNKWTEHIYIQSPGGQNKTAIKLVNFAENNVLDTGKTQTRSTTVTMPANINIGNQGVFVVELVPDNELREPAASLANNKAVQQATWSINRVLTLDLSASQTTEGASQGITAFISRSGSLTDPLTVSISTKYPQRYTTPSSITIPAGQSGVSFIVVAIENDAIEGPFSDTLQVTATGFPAVESGFTVQDNDLASLTINELPEQITEGEMVQFTVATNLASSDPLTVYLTSSVQSKFPVPASVIIPAGKLSAEVTVTIPQNTTPEVDQSINIKAGAANQNGVSKAIQVTDDDLPNLELVLQTTSVSESSGLYATQATLRRSSKSSSIAFSANLSATVPNTLILPARISLGANENEKTFSVGVIDNALAEGQRQVTLTASVYVASCGCSAPVSSSGSVTADLTINDNDGPSLTLQATPLTLPEGASNAGMLRITRNTSTMASLEVSLSSSNPAEATLPMTATIPAGKAFVEVPITTLNDGATDGSQTVYFKAEAKDFSAGSVWVVVTDQNKPDLLIPSASLSDNSVQALNPFSFNISVKNDGLATAPSGVVVHGYLSKDDMIDAKDSLLISGVIENPIPVGQSASLQHVIKAPNVPGKYKLIFKVNPESSMTELLITNNTSVTISLDIKPDYTATANVQPTYFLKGDTVHISGVAKKANSSAAKGVSVEVYVITQGFRRTFTAKTDDAGNYSSAFVPMLNEYGHYIIGASFPGMELTDEQDAFDILGIRLNDGNAPTFLVKAGETLTGTMKVQNLSNRSLTEFSLEPRTLPNGAVINFDTLPSLAGNTTVSIGYEVSGTSLTSGKNYEIGVLQAVAKEGIVQDASFNYYCQAPKAYLQADISRIDVKVSQAKGEQVVEFRVVNKGAGASGDIIIELPQTNWVRSVTPKLLPSLSAGDTAVVIVKFLALQDVPFEYPVKSSIAINCANGSGITVPFTFEKVSQSTGAVRITVTDQFTYYAQGGPKVEGANVVIRNYFTGVVYAQGNTNADGLFTAQDIPEGKHRIVVEKDKHQSYDGLITINPGGAVDKEVFLNYQAITFNWSVVPTAVQDQYDINLEAKFETHVPMPVVTMQMPKVFPQLSGTDTYAFNITITNHGLITAQQVQLTLPVDQEYEFVSNYQPMDLLAQQSIQVPVIMRRRAEGQGSVQKMSFAQVSRMLNMKSASPANDVECLVWATLQYLYSCGIHPVGGVAGEMAQMAGRTCDGFLNWIPNFGGFGSGSGGGPATGGSVGNNNNNTTTTPPPSVGYTTTKSNCDPGIDDYLNGGGGSGLRAGLRTMAKSTSTYEPPAALKEAVENSNLARTGIRLRDTIDKEYFGLLPKRDGWHDLYGPIQVPVKNIDSIRAPLQESVLQHMQGFEITGIEIRAAFNRWNTSVYARSQGVLEPGTQYPGIINWKSVNTWSDSLDWVNDQVMAKGYTSVDEMLQKSLDAIDQIVESQKNAVCAAVKVQFSQKLTMTREAFEGTLDIFNGHPTDMMESLSVDIRITDENGVPSNGLFEIQTKSLTNLPDVTGTGFINAQQHGIVKFLFIPTINAAPTTPKVYKFGGSVRYWDPYVKAMVTMPLNDVELTVNPSPNLMLHYFMQRNILGDDPFTSPAIEPSTPAELSVMVENQGYGPAVNMSISSAQPKVIENEKGLAINFQLIGSNFQGQPTKFGVTDINFGTVPGQQTRVGQWYFTSSLLGKFVSYEASVVHANSFGNPELSLVKGVKLHELTKSIKLYGADDDQINDFLVNDIFDVNDEPDVIYLSQGHRTEKVYPAAGGSFSSPVSSPSFTNTLTVTASDTGWNFIKLNDPGNGLYELVSVTRNDGQAIPLDNGWLTFVTLPVGRTPVYENKFHFVDKFPSTTPVTYTVVWKPKNRNNPKVVKIEGVPGQVAAEPVAKLKVVFDKAIDAATFTREDLALSFQGGQNIIDQSVVINQLDTTTFEVNLAQLATGNGFYAFTVQAANIKDIFGINGTKGKNVTWTQFVSVPMVQAFKGIPENKTASAFDTIQIQFNVPVDKLTVTPQHFTITKDGVAQRGTVTIDSVRADHKLFYLSGLNNILTESGEYQFTVDLPNIRSVDGVQGQEPQSIKLVVDNKGPLMMSIAKLDSGALDAQHIPFVRMNFSEDVVGLNTASLRLTRNGEVLPVTFDMLSNTDLKTWTAGNFGMLTYNDGEYKLTIDMTGVKDAIGNAGVGTQQVSWTVDRSSVVEITSLAITPDNGHSNSDGITSDPNITVTFNLGRDASQVTVYQYGAGVQTALATVDNVLAGEVSIPVTLSPGSNVGIRVTAEGATSGVGTAERNLYIDQLPLTVKWNAADNESVPRQPDTLSVSFSDKLLNSSALAEGLIFSKNGTSLPVNALSIKAVNDTLYEITGLRSISASSGNYQVGVDLRQLQKYTSGKEGNSMVPLSWTVRPINQAPIANAGKDLIVSNPGTITLNATSSYDPDGSEITYRWIAPEGIELNDETSAMPTFNLADADRGKTYEFLMIADDGESFSSARVKVTFNSCTILGTWQGNVDSNWENPLNWSCNKVPDEFTDVKVPAGVPLILSTNAKVRSITLSANSDFTIRKTGSLEVKN